MKITKGNVQQEMIEKKNSLRSQLVEDASEEDTRIELLIREKYSLTNEICLHRKKMMGTLEDSEWNEYTAYVEECIVKAREEHPDGND